jgi:hypothetical protein
MIKRLQIYCSLIFLLLFFSQQVFSQSFSNGFESENQIDTWFNESRYQDSTAFNGEFVSRCDSETLYGCGFEKEFPGFSPDHSLMIKFSAMFRSLETPCNAKYVFTIVKDQKTIFWKSLDLIDFLNDTITTTTWVKATFDFHVPSDEIKDATFKAYLWNTEKHTIDIDDITFTFENILLPTYFPECFYKETPISYPKIITQTPFYELQYIEANKQVFVANNIGKQLARMVLITEFEKQTDTVFLESFDWKIVRKKNLQNGYETTLKNKNTYSKTTLRIRSDFDSPELQFDVETRFRKRGRLLRQALVLQFLEPVDKVYRTSKKLDTASFQRAYYLENEGFAFGEKKNYIGMYHAPKLSSIQLDTKLRNAFLNLDFWRDHPFIQFPLDNDTSDFFVDHSAREVKSSTKLGNAFCLTIGVEPAEIPRLMPVWNGYETAIIWTEHADWTDIRTHRAANFGHENICDADSAVGGFVGYGIPVTKSVFYNNPDSITNDAISDNFSGLHTTIETHPDFFEFLLQLKSKGFEICLHTPEQYSSTQQNLKESLYFMQQHFGSPTWIDHGYNNNMLNNRENIVCDGLNKKSRQYAAKHWKNTGVRYFWNAFMEEANPYKFMKFDANFAVPYPGFGDAFPNRKITQFPFEKNALLWSTISTFEIHNDNSWDFFFSDNFMKNLIKHRSIQIFHIYASWVNPKKGFWHFDANGDIVASPGFNRALQKIAALKQQHLLLPTTINEWLSYYEKLQKVTIQTLADGSIRLKNCGDKPILGISLIAQCSDIQVENKNIHTRKSGLETIFWFDLEAGEQVNICFSNKNTTNQ